MKILHGAGRHRSILVLASAIAILGAGPSHASTGTSDETRSTPPRISHALPDGEASILLPMLPANGSATNADRSMMADSSGSGGSGGGDRKLEEKKKKDDKKKKKKQAWDDFIKGVQEDTKEQEKKQKSKSN